MAWDAPGAYQYSFPADVDLSKAASQQFLAVNVQPAKNVAGNGQGNAAVVPFAAANGKPALGLLQNAPKQGEAATIMTQGWSRCIASGAWEAGDALSIKDGGQLQKAGGSDAIFAIAGESAVAGDTSSCYLK